MSPIDYVIHFRLKQAARLLDTTENSISSIAQNTDFNNVGYFCRKFKDVYKLTPSQYRKTRPNTKRNPCIVLRSMQGFSFSLSPTIFSILPLSVLHNSILV